MGRLGGSGLGSEGLGNVVVDGERREAHNCHGCGDRLMVPTKVFDDKGFIARFYDVKVH